MQPNGVPGGGLKPLGSKAGKKQAKCADPQLHDHDQRDAHHIPQHQAQQQLAAVMGRLQQLSAGQPVEQFVQQRASTTAGAMALAKELQTSLWGNNRTASTDGLSHTHHHGAPSSHATTLDPKMYYEAVQPSEWRPEPSDSYLSLYRRAYCGLMDLMVPPLVFATMAAWAAVMPMWMLLLCTPVTFIGITFCCLTQGAGMGPSEIGESRLTVSLVLCFELLMPIIYIYDIIPLLPELWASHCTLLTIIIMALMMHVWLITSNPGKLQPAAAGAVNKDPEAVMEGGMESMHHDGHHTSSHHGGVGDGMYENGGNARGEYDGMHSNSSSKHNGNHIVGATTQQYGDGERNIPSSIASLYSTCDTCHITRPLRSRHCPACHACIERQDHHCPAINNCVGAANVRTFAAWQFAVLCGQVTFLVLAVRCLWRQAYMLAQRGGVAAAPTVGAVWTQWGVAVGMHRRTALFAIAVAFMTCGTAYLVFRFTYCICGNLTTAELLNKRKYAYLRDAADGFCNRFDDGVGVNCVEFWTSGVKQWREARAAAAVAARTGHVPPKMSITTLLRSWEEREALLYRARAEARRKREAWLLETYGGVKDGRLHEEKSQQGDARPCCSHGGHHHH